MTAQVFDLDERRREHQPASPISKLSARTVERLQLSAGREHLLGELDPPITAVQTTAKQLCSYFGISYSALSANTARNRSELLAIGWKPYRSHEPSQYSRRAIIHIALILKQGSSVRADEIKKALGVWVEPGQGPKPRDAGRRTRRHEEHCRGLIRRAYGLIEAVQECSPDEVWDELAALDRHDLQALVVTLGALVPSDVEGLQRYLVGLGRDEMRSRGTVVHPSRTAGLGLTRLVPPCDTGDDLG
ncbi:hypothetical protein B5566_02680 [Mycobacterium sp. MHSD3]|nr:hypothetical protein B5566_02680 [Mycobacterium sp. MHSD3]